MGKRGEGAAEGFTLGIESFLAEDPAVRVLLDQDAKLLESLPPEERAREEARMAAEEDAARRHCADQERAYETAIRAADRALEEEHHQIESDRRAGVIGTLTEVGRPHGLSGIKAGRVLDLHGLREVVDVHVPVVDPRCNNALPLHLMRGVAEGVAVHDRFNGRTFWVAAKVSPLLAGYAKHKP